MKNGNPEATQKAASVPAVSSVELLGPNPPNDGREYDCQCARCGSSVHWEECGACGGEGTTAPGELYEQDPLWYDEDAMLLLNPTVSLWSSDSLKTSSLWASHNSDAYENCHQCGGEASWGICMSCPEWCEANPAPGREAIKRGVIEWYCVERPK